MEHSNCGCNCSFVKSGFCQTDKECPFYTESWWQENGSPTPKLVKDCFPKRMSIEQNNLLHRHLALQSVVEDVRNRLSKIELMLEVLISQSKEFIASRDRVDITSSYEPFKMLDNKKD